MKGSEITICGLAAVRARFQRDASSIVRLFFDRQTSKRIGIICRALAADRKVYRCVEAAELERVAGSVHHGGIVAVVDDRPPRVATAQDAGTWSRRRENLVVLDRVGNAHNLGAIARTAAYLGVPRVVIAGDPAAARPGAAGDRAGTGYGGGWLWRVAERGLCLPHRRVGGHEDCRLHDGHGVHRD